MPKEVKRSTLALVVLALLRTQPMHPYEVQQKIRQWGKDQVIDVRQRSSIYRTIERLAAAGLVEVQGVERDAQRPERTVYAITDRGSSVVHAWQMDILATPASEFPAFPAALSLLPVLPVEDVIEALTLREAGLVERLAALDAEVADAQRLEVPRLFLIETEYVRAVLVAERDWVAELLGQLRAGELTWDQPWLQAAADKFAQLEAEGGLPPDRT